MTGSRREDPPTLPSRVPAPRVLHLLKTATGARWALLQMRELVRLGASVHVALPDGPLVPAYREAGVDVHVAGPSLSLDRPWSLAAHRELRALVDAVAPDIVHSHFVATTMLARLALRDHAVPRVFQVPGPLHLESVHTRLAEIALSDRRDYWIASCEWTRQRYLASGIAADRVFLAYYGLERPAASSPVVALRSELGLPPTARLVGMVAYMYPPKWIVGQRRGLKGHEDFIEAIAICRRSGLDVHGVCVGGAWGGADWYERRVRRHAEARSPDGAHLLGHRADVAAIYPALDVAVHPSHSENCGGAFESLWHAVPTIATRVGGLPDVVIPDQTGWLVPPRDPATLAATIGHVLAHLEHARALATAGHALIARQFTVERTALDVLTHYRTILASLSLLPSPFLLP